VPNLLIAEAYLRGSSERTGTAGRIAMASLMIIAAGMLGVATYFFATQYWWPMVARTIA